MLVIGGGDAIFLSIGTSDRSASWISSDTIGAVDMSPCNEKTLLPEAFGYCLSMLDGVL